MRTPGITGRCGKCPVKNGSFAVTFFIPTILSLPLTSTIRSTSRKGNRWGGCA